MLSAAPRLERHAGLGRRRRLVPAPARIDAGTASQLIASVRQTHGATSDPSQLAPASGGRWASALRALPAALARAEGRRGLPERSASRGLGARSCAFADSSWAFTDSSCAVDNSSYRPTAWGRCLTGSWRWPSPTERRATLVGVGPPAPAIGHGPPAVRPRMADVGVESCAWASVEAPSSAGHGRCRTRR